jgi:CheY-like chemotaxis protein
LESIIPEDGEVVRKFGADDPVVQISVTDTGIGMSDEVQRRVFEPFYTTKNAEGGTGLGLATVYGIIEQSGGLVKLTSAPGEGTTFRVLLPLAAGAELTRSSVVDRAPHRGSGTVLVVDDDQSLRYLVRRTLRSVGYTVLMAEDGNAALRLIEEHQGAIQLLLTDLVMPEMSGHELARRSREVNPGLRVLYMSGYTEDEAMRQSMQNDGTAFVAKPFSVSSLTRGVSRALGLGD